MAIFQGTNGDDSILRGSLSAGVVSDPPATGTETGVSNYIDAGAGRDTIEAGNGDGDDFYRDGDEIHGGAGRDTITGGGGADYIYGEGGNDVIWGGDVAGWADFIDGGDGNDVIHAADNLYNWIDGGAGADKMYGGAYDDEFVVDNARDRVIEVTNTGYESVFASIARYTLPTNVEYLYFGFSERAQVGVGNRLSNGIYTSDGDDRLYGKGGDDTLWSEAGDDRLYGGDGNDTLYAGSGADRLFGGSGRDELNGGDGADRMVGGTGHDVFAFYDVSDSPASQRDVIAPGDGAIAFEGAGRAAGDLIDLSYMDADLTTSDFVPFTFGGTGKGHLSLVDSGGFTLVRGNLDDDASFEFQVLIDDGNVRASAYTADDFLLA